jgi:hypothetical protein
LYKAANLTYKWKHSLFETKKIKKDLFYHKYHYFDDKIFFKIRFHLSCGFLNEIVTLCSSCETRLKVSACSLRGNNIKKTTENKALPTALSK